MVVGNEYNKSPIKFADSYGYLTSKLIVTNVKESGFKVPSEEMVKKLSEYYQKPAYKYRAFEFEITLDLDVYKATRQVIVPAELTLIRFHTILQRLFDWDNKHLYSFSLLNERNFILSSTEDIEQLREIKLSDFMPKYKSIRYTYDFGDNWEHEIQLIKEISDCEKEPPYLVSAEGQAPPEDVGGVIGFAEFYKIINDSKHPEYKEMREWARYWMSKSNRENSLKGLIY